MSCCPPSALPYLAAKPATKGSKKAIAADELLATLRKERRAPTADEQALIDDAEAAREVIIQVDSFPRLGAEISQPAAWTAEDRPALDALASSARSNQQFA